MIKAREEKNMTQIELSKLTGISQADISRLENGDANPIIEMLNRIATNKAFDTNNKKYSRDTFAMIHNAGDRSIMEQKLPLH